MEKSEGQKIYKYSCGHGEFAWFPPEDKNYEEWLNDNSMCSECHKKYSPAKEPNLININNIRYYSLYANCPLCGYVHVLKIEIVNYDSRASYNCFSGTENDCIDAICPICNYKFSTEFLYKKEFVLKK